MKTDKAIAPLSADVPDRMRSARLIRTERALAARRERGAEERLLRAAELASGLAREEITGKSRRVPAAAVRHAVWYIAVQTLGLSLALTSEVFGGTGGRDHTTILHGVNRVRNDMHTGGPLADLVAGIAGAWNGILEEERSCG
ncbi:MAG: hypothetical protein KIT79_12780 [Deltaproteobacteria bacterium]|nr:hypothetical protein [Deltaproteobacteria bacterium]